MNKIFAQYARIRKAYDCALEVIDAPLPTSFDSDYSTLSNALEKVTLLGSIIRTYNEAQELLHLEEGPDAVSATLLKLDEVVEKLGVAKKYCMHLDVFSDA